MPRTPKSAKHSYNKPSSEKLGMEPHNFLIACLKEIATLFSEADIRFCLAGGIAVGILSAPRATEDIDLIIAIDPDDQERILTRLKHSFTIVQNKEIVNFSFGKLWRLIVRQKENSELFILDLIIAESEILRKAVDEAFEIIVDGISIPVITKENLIRMKSGSARLKDRMDIETLSAETDQ
jgi:hypothetical protein